MFMVSFCDRCDERHQQFALNDISSYTPGPTDSKPGRKYGATCRSKAAKIVLIGNPRLDYAIDGTPLQNSQATC